MLKFKKSDYEAIRAHGEETYPYECCGLLIGTISTDLRSKTVLETYPISNAREEEARHHRSLILPEEYLRGERYASSKGLAVVGNYHSHPDHVAVPSKYDLEHAWPTWSYIIVSVRQGSAVDLRSWEMQSDRLKFDEEEITKGK